MEHEFALNPAAPHFLPWFITTPGSTDYLFNAMIIFLIVVIFAVGLFYLRLHALPEHLSHGASKMQLQVVGVLCLLALFTHNHIFWIAALFIALIEIPDFSTPLGSIATSLEKISGRAPPQTWDSEPFEADAAPPTALPEPQV